MAEPRRRPEPDDVLALPAGVDPDALMDAWLDMGVDAQAGHDADAEAQQIKRRLDDVQREDRRKRAWDTHMTGATHRQIAEMLGISPGQVCKDIHRYAQVAVPLEDREVARRVSVDRLQLMLRRLMVRFAQESGDDQLKVVDRVLRVQLRLDELHQVNDATPSDTPTADLGSLNEVDERLFEFKERAALQAEVDALAAAGMLDGPPPGHPG